MGLRRIHPNRRRGEMVAEIDGEARVLCLTLGALAELEAAFEADDLTDLVRRFSTGRLSAADMMRIVGAGLRGGGNVFGDDEVAAMSIDGGARGFAELVASLLEATFASADDRGEAGGRARPNP